MKDLAQMFRLIKPYAGVAVMGLLLVVLPVAMELVVPQMLRVIIDDGIRPGDMAVITRASLIMLGAAVIGALATLGQGVFRAQLSQGVAFDLRNELFTHIQSLSYGNLDRMQTGQLMTRLSSDVDTLRFFFSAGLALLLRAVLMIAGSTVMLVIIDWQLSLIMFILLALSAALLGGVMRAATPMYMQAQQKLSALNTVVQENLAGVRVVKAFVREYFEINRFEERSVAYMAQNIKVGQLIAVALPVITILTNLGLVASVWWGGVDVINGQLSVGQLVAFNNYLLIGMAPLLLLSNVLTMISRADASSTRILELLKTAPLIQSAATPHRAKTIHGHVAFENVSFHYGQANGSGEHEVLDGVSFEVQPGQQVALLGATGSGKTTLVNLIPRFYDVTGGRLTVDGIDVRNWTPEMLRLRVGMVLQQTTLFSGTIRENIAYGRPDASLDEVIAAATAAQAHNFITAMPDGYNSVVEARGTNLSGGQRQRIAIARALLISPAILVLDDCTSAVDFETEVKIQQALETLMANRTTFIIAQRINSVLKADQIMVLDAGHIVAQGTHRQLLQNSPIYQEIYYSQLGEGSMAGSRN